jgi:hypothetical protein
LSRILSFRKSGSTRPSNHNSTPASPPDRGLAPFYSPAL